MRSRRWPNLEEEPSSNIGGDRNTAKRHDVLEAVAPESSFRVSHHDNRLSRSCGKDGIYLQSGKSFSSSSPPSKTAKATSALHKREMVQSPQEINDRYSVRTHKSP